MDAPRTARNRVRDEDARAESVRPERIALMGRDPVQSAGLANFQNRKPLAIQPRAPRGDGPPERILARDIHPLRAERDFQRLRESLATVRNWREV